MGYQHDQYLGRYPISNQWDDLAFILTFRDVLRSEQQFSESAIRNISYGTPASSATSTPHRKVTFDADSNLEIAVDKQRARKGIIADRWLEDGIPPANTAIRPDGRWLEERSFTSFFARYSEKSAPLPDEPERRCETCGLMLAVPSQHVCQHNT